MLTSSLLCEALKVRFRESELHYLINTHTTPVLENNPYIDKQIVYTPEMEGSISLRKALHASLKNEKYDLVIDVYSKLGSAFISKATKSPLRIGYKKWYTKWAYTHRFIYDKKAKTEAGLAVENRLKLLEPLALDFPEFIKPKIYLTESELQKGEMVLKNGGLQLDQKICMIAVLGSGPTKTYPLSYMAKVLDHIVIRTSSQLILNYIPKQQGQVQELLSLVKDQTRACIFDKVYGKSLREFLSLTSHCNAIIGNEGGAINMAKAIDIPTFSIFPPWISREAWGLFENNLNVSVHLKDIHPEVYKNENAQKIKGDIPSYYEMMTPDHITKKMDGFLNNVLAPSL